MTKPGDLVVLTASDVDRVLEKLDLELALASQRDVFTAFSSSSKGDEIQIPHRSTLVTPAQRTLVMPSRAGDELGCKFVGIPNEGSGGLPGTTVVLDPKTGAVKALVNARKLTALRNACGSALSLRALPPKRDPTNLLIFGSGAQAHAHARVFLRLFPSFTSCTIVVRSITPRSEALLSDLRSAFPKHLFTLGDSSDPPTTFNLSQAVHNASVILTLVPTTTPLFNSVDVTSGTHLVLVGSYKPEMRDVEDDLIRRAGIVLVDSKKACSQEAGELIRAGLGSDSDSLVELGELFGQNGGGGGGGAEDLRSRIQASGDVTVFKSVGIGIQDIAIASLVMDEATKMGLGTIIQGYD